MAATDAQDWAAIVDARDEPYWTSFDPAPAEAEPAAAEPPASAWEEIRAATGPRPYCRDPILKRVQRRY